MSECGRTHAEAHIDGLELPKRGGVQTILERLDEVAAPTAHARSASPHTLKGPRLRRRLSLEGRRRGKVAAKSDVFAQTFPTTLARWKLPP